MPHNRAAASRCFKVLVASALALLCALAAGPGRSTAQIVAPPDAPHSVALWQPAYTSYLLLSDTDDLVTLARQDDTLWLATERVVSRYQDGVWTQPETVADDAMILALAPLGHNGDAVAFGFEGGIWLRTGGRWATVSSPTGADLYDAYAFSAHDVWAVGFDYDRSVGAVVHYDGFGFSAISPSWLTRRQLLAIDGTSSGELWAGGCDGNDYPFLMRDQGAGLWQPVSPPPVAGCVEDIAFTADGRGLAAVDGDIMWFDGQTWTPFGQPPPEGTSWVKVALDTDEPVPVEAGVKPRGWAVPGTPTWRGYIDAAEPWYFDGDAWKETTADYRGYEVLFRPSQAYPGAQPFLDVVSAPGGPIAVCRSVVQSEQPGQRRAGLMQLGPAVARLEHPLIFSLGMPGPYGTLAAQGMGDIAASEADTVWAGAYVGAAPLLGRSAGAGWQVAPGDVQARGRDFWIQSVDSGSSVSAWAFGGTTSGLDRAPAMWRLVAGRWVQEPVPTGADRYLMQLRALPDGGAWALSSQPRLQVFDGAAWQELPEQTPVLGPAWAPDGQTQLIGLRAPFDAASGPLGTSMGWVASHEYLYQVLAGRFEAVERIPRGQVLDLQLVDQRHGWAIGYQDPLASGGRPPGVLLRLEDRLWSEEDLTQALLDSWTGPGVYQSSPALDPRSVRWWLMSAVSPTEVWLLGGVSQVGRPGVLVPILVRFRADPRGGPAHDVLVVRDCSIDALSAVAVQGGTDVWLMSRTQCGTAVSSVSNPYAGPVSVIRVRDTVGKLYLPALRLATGGR